MLGVLGVLGVEGLGFSSGGRRSRGSLSDAQVLADP